MRAVPASVSAPAKVCHRAAASPADVSKPARPKPPCVRGARSSNCESRITNHGRSGRSGPPLCGGTPPATPPRSYATVRARPQQVCQRPGSNATAPTGSSPLATGHWQLSTAVPQSAHAIPCTSLQNVLYCKVQPEHTQAGPERAASHNGPPTMPRPQTMSTCSEPNVPILLQANFAPGSAGNDSKCAELPSAAPPTHSVMTPAMQPMPALPAPGSVSCHEKHAAVVVLRTFGTQNDIFCAFSRQKRQGTDSGRILLRESMPISCHENTDKFFKVGPNRPKQAIQYPIDTLSIPDFPEIRSHFTTQYDALGSILDRFGRILDRMRGFTAKETDAATGFDPDFGTRRRNDPQRGPLLAQ